MSSTNDIIGIAEGIRSNEIAHSNLESRLAQALLIAVDMLNHIASWEEGDTVTGKFDEPSASHNARLALSRIQSLPTP
jgi:hypothetical protein